MKRLEAIIKNDKLSETVAAIRGAGAKGVTVTSIKGQGSADRPMVRSGRGTAQVQAEYNNMVSIMTVVGDSEVDAVISAISDSTYTGKNGDGIVIVSDVNKVVNIASKETNESAL